MGDALQSRVKVLLMGALLGVAAEVAAEDLVDFSGKWVLEKAEQDFKPTEPMRSLGPASGPMQGANVDVRTGGDGSYRGGEGRIPSDLGNFSAPDLVLSITQSATGINMERKWTRNRQPMISHDTYSLDGKDTIVRDSAGKIEAKSKTKWRKGGLTIDSIHNVKAMGGRMVEVRVRQELTLSEDGRVLNVKTTQEIPNGKVFIRQTFNKS